MQFSCYNKMKQDRVGWAKARHRLAIFAIRVWHGDRCNMRSTHEISLDLPLQMEVLLLNPTRSISSQILLLH